MTIPTLLAQTGPNGSISGTVKEAGTGMPLKDAAVSAAGSSRTQVITDAQGRYTLSGLTPGRLAMLAVGAGNIGAASKVITLGAGQDLTGIDLEIRTFGVISGKVRNSEMEPLAKAQVVLMRREYRDGVLEDWQVMRASTSDDGAYRFVSIEPGRSYILFVAPDHTAAKPEAPAKERKPELPRTYYPGTTDPEGAAAIVLRSGETRDGVDLRVTPSPAYCVDGIIEMNGEPAKSKWDLSREDGRGIVVDEVAGATAGADGRFHTCSVFPGTYRLTGVLPTGPAAMTLVSVRDADVHDVRLDLRPTMGISIRADWDGQPPDAPANAELTVSLRNVRRSVNLTQTIAGAASNTITLAPDDYHVELMGLPRRCYVKSLTIGGVESVRKPFMSFRSVLNGAGIHLVLAKDGGTITGTVADADGHPSANIPVYIISKDATSLPELAQSMLSIASDQNGQFSAGTLTPGNYQVLATESPLLPTPESMARLLQSRSGAQDVEVKPSDTAQVKLAPVEIR